ncbi:GGDEF domain-containing protein [Vibrio ouci]|uniref:GGDEF domain-containing protein n=1 Tax=Vibrio ouci TaxID=2499078 RepID=A0A4Y8WKN0_9VIBR|nr:GGDEF domain-containing protein [Vibrio ouci]TFH93259.1 GGDEF domain-containing protein [Vibrio ouci]
MPQLAGRQIEEMADIRATRKSNIVLLCSLISIVILTSYGVVRYLSSDYFLCAINFFSSLLLLLNTLYLYKHQVFNHSGLVLSGVLLFHGVVLLLYGEHINDRLLWLYPIIAVLIFVNDFKVGALMSVGFCVLTLIAIQFPQAVHFSESGSKSRFLLSLFSLCLLCNISAYYYAKVMNYIHSLYLEGIEDLAYLDQLTGLANRWSFENWAAGKLVEKENSPKITAMVFIDIDNFKSINDTYGHDVGDRVLQYFAKRLRNNVRNKDRKTDKHDYSIARFAGDEFVLLLYDVKKIDDLESILNRISHLFTESYQSSERINTLTVSVGVSLYPDDASTLSELTRCADKAMYAAKHSGKNQYRFYSDNKIPRALSEQEKNLANVTSIK